MTGPRRSRISNGLPTEIPFVAPEVLERRAGQPFRARLGANESSFGTSPAALEAMRRELHRSAWYGDPESRLLREAIAARLGIGTENVTVACGIDDLQSIAVRAYLDPGDVAVMSLGAYPTFAYHVLGAGATIRTVPYDGDDRNDVPALLASAREHRARLVFLANPDNPSGSWLPGAAIDELLAGLPTGCLLLLDEAYGEFAPAGPPVLDIEDPRLIRFRTFSKAYGMAGLRIGYALGERSVLAPFDGLRLHFGVSRIAQAGALAAWADQGFLASVVTAVAEGRQDYERIASGLGLRSLPSSTNFVAIDCGGAAAASSVLEGLVQRGVFVRKPTHPPLDRCIRVTVGSPEERQVFAEALREAL